MTDNTITAAADTLDAHVRDIVAWHFSEETGTPYWLDWARSNFPDVRNHIHGLEDLTMTFPLFDDTILRTLPHKHLIPRAYRSKPFKVFETGGTTGAPRQRLSWQDHLEDYTEFSRTLCDEHFPPHGNWLMLGPTGPRRLRLSIEHLANLRGGGCYFVDLDPRWVKALVVEQRPERIRVYKQHVINQALTVLRHREVRCLFTTPLLLEALGERISIADAGIRGVFCGGTTMTPQTVRFLVEEVLENRVGFVPTYGNTLMGLACSLPPAPEANYSVTYWAPQPRAVLRVVKPDAPDTVVGYGDYGRVELTTMTREFFMPRLLERDEGIRRPPTAAYPWDGVADIRPFQSDTGTIVEGVY